MELPYKPELPQDILSIIKEYAKPVTRPDWRTAHKFTQSDLCKELFAMTHVILSDNASVLIFKNMLLVFEGNVFCVFRFQEYLTVPS